MNRTTKRRRVKAPPRLRIERGGNNGAPPTPSHRRYRIGVLEERSPYGVILCGEDRECRPAFRLEIPEAWVTGDLIDFFGRAMEQGGFDFGGRLERHELPARPCLTLERGGLS